MFLAGLDVGRFFVRWHVHDTSTSNGIEVMEHRRGIAEFTGAHGKRRVIGYGQSKTQSQALIGYASPPWSETLYGETDNEDDRQKMTQVERSGQSTGEG